MAPNACLLELFLQWDHVECLPVSETIAASLFSVCLVTDCVTHCEMPPATSPSLSRTEGSHNMRKNVCCEQLVIVCSSRNKWENRCSQSCSIPFWRRGDFIASPSRARHSGELVTREKPSINLQRMQCWEKPYKRQP